MTSKQNGEPITALKEVFDSNRGATDAKIKSVFRKKIIASGEAAVAAVIDGFVDYYLSYARREPAPNRNADRERDHEQIAAAAEAMRLAVRMSIARTISLSYVMPNGRRLGDCTFAEVALMGGFFIELAGKGTPSQLVREVLTTGQIRGLLGAPIEQKKVA